MLANLEPLEGSRSSAWYAVRTHSQREALAEQHLKRQNFPVLYPRTFSPLKPRAGKPSTPATRAFFPGYIFVGLDLDRDRWRCVNSTIGVIGLVQFGERPAPVPPGFVSALMARTSASGTVEPADDLAIGDAVRIMGGPFDQMIATLVALPRRDRVSVLVEMMTRVVPIELPRAALVSLAQHGPAVGASSSTRQPPEPIRMGGRHGDQ